MGGAACASLRQGPPSSRAQTRRECVAGEKAVAYNVSMRRRTWLWVAGSAVFLAAVLAPYLAAWRGQPPGFVFSGFLVNPIDGFSYLAKMRQGAAGEWLFRLPYAAEPGEGAFLFLFYIALGHFQRILGAAPETVYHAVRIAGAAAMLLAAAAFYRTTMGDALPRRWAMGLVAFGAGLGWAGLTLGRMALDLWVPEAIPFLSAYANPHFPWSAAVMLFAMTMVTAPALRRSTRIVGAALSGVVLALVQPFAVIPVVAIGLVWGAWMVWSPTADGPAKADRRERGMAWLAFVAASVPWLAYDWWIARTHPALAAWSAQNLTPSPPLIDVVLGFGLVLALAVAALAMLRPDRTAGGRLLAVWLVVGMLLVFLPFGLQRRMLLGLFFPMAGLAGLALSALASAGPDRKALALVLFVLCLPTNVVVVAATLGGALGQEPEVVMTSAERGAYAWIAGNVPEGSLILAGGVTGNRLPAYADVRVRYGHPFETPDAAAELAWVDSVYRSRAPAEDVLTEIRRRSVEAVFVGPRERALGELSWLAALVPVYRGQDVSVYELPPQ